VQPDVEACLFLPQNRGTTAASLSKVVPAHQPRLSDGSRFFICPDPARDPPVPSLFRQSLKRHRN
jgi:hypothetical protein